MASGIIRVSTDGDGNQSLSLSGAPVLAPDGGSVAYEQVANATSTGGLIYQKDLATGDVTLVSLRLNDGTQSAGKFQDAAWSPDGSKIAYAMDTGTDANYAGIYINDLVAHTITEVVSTPLNLTAGSLFFNPRFSPDGSKLVFLSDAPLAGASSGTLDTYVLTLAGGALLRLPGVAGVGAVAPSFSPDGGSVLFSSDDAGLVPGDTNGGTDLFIEDLTSHVVTRVNTASDGAQASAGGTIRAAAFSPNGRMVAFIAADDGYVPGHAANAAEAHLFLKNLDSGAITAIDIAADGDWGNGQVQSVAFSPDGTQIYFSSGATNLVDGATGVGGIYDKDLTTGALTQLLATTDGQPPNGFAGTLSISADGTELAFDSGASNLVAGDTNGASDVFLLAIDVAPVAVADSYAASYGAVLHVSAAAGVLANDTDANHDALTAQLVSGPAHGALVLQADGSFTYTPNGSFVGSDSFSYRASDGDKPSQAVSVTIGVAGNITRVSVAADGTQGSSGVEFDTPRFSPDGESVLFTTVSSTLESGGSSGFQTVVLKNLLTGAITTIGSASGETASNGAFSPDGGRVVYADSGAGIVVVDLATGVHMVVSTTADGTPGNGFSASPSFSPDGNEVVFTTSGNTLAAGETNLASQVFVKNLVTGALTLISASASGVIGDGYSSSGVFSPDGHSVAFTSSASNLVAGGTGGIFIKNLDTGAVTRVDTSANGTPGDGYADEAVFSPDGTSIAFISAADNLTTGSTRGVAQVYVKNLVTGEIRLVSSTADGAASSAVGTLGSAFPVFSPDGSRIAFYSPATDLVPGFDNVAGAVFEKNLITGAVRLVSADSFEAGGDDWASRPSYSPDGKSIVFFSHADNLVAGDTNRQADIFIKDLTVFPLGSALAGSVPAGGRTAIAWARARRW